MTADRETQFTTIIGADATFKGDLKFDSSAKLLGNIEGSINAKGIIHIANGSRCKATISAKEVAVEGHVEGNVEASDRVELKPNGAITGDIVASKMTMADGASIDGYCRIGVEGGKARSSTEVKPTATASTSASSSSSSSTEKDKEKERATVKSR